MSEEKHELLHDDELLMQWSESLYELACSQARERNHKQILNSRINLARSIIESYLKQDSKQTDENALKFIALLEGDKHNHAYL